MGLALEAWHLCFFSSTCVRQSRVSGVALFFISMNPALYSPLQEWRSCVCIWHEMLLQCPVPRLRVELNEEFMLVIPCVGLGRMVTDDEIHALAGLIGRWKMEWKGVTTLRRLETTGRCPNHRSVEVIKVAESVYLVGGSLVVRKSSILLFDSVAHMRLYVQIVDRELDLDTFCSLCATLSIEAGRQNSEALLMSFSDQRVDKLFSPMLWRNLVALMWPDVEVVSTARWQAERCGGVLSIELVVHSVTVLDELMSTTRPIILVERDAQGRHTRCLLVMVCVSPWTENTGTVLFVSYVGFEARR